MAFKVATQQAFKKGIMEAKPVLLEPIVTLKVVVPEGYTGDVMGELNKRRARVMGMEPDRQWISGDSSGYSLSGALWIQCHTSLNDERKRHILI